MSLPRSGLPGRLHARFSHHGGGRRPPPRGRVMRGRRIWWFNFYDASWLALSFLRRNHRPSHPPVNSLAHIRPTRTLYFFHISRHRSLNPLIMMLGLNGMRRYTAAVVFSSCRINEIRPNGGSLLRTGSTRSVKPCRQDKSLHTLSLLHTFGYSGVQDHPVNHTFGTSFSAPRARSCAHATTYSAPPPVPPVTWNADSSGFIKARRHLHSKAHYQASEIPDAAPTLILQRTKPSVYMPAARVAMAIDSAVQAGKSCIDFNREPMKGFG